MAPRALQFVQQELDDRRAALVTEQLSQCLLMPGETMLRHEVAEVPGCVAGERRLGEMRVLGMEVGGFGLDIGEVAPAAT